MNVVLLNVVVLLVSTLAVYWRTLKYDLVSDDIPTQRRTTAAREVKPDKKFNFFEGLYWDLRGVYNVKRCHVLSLACHTATVVFIYLAFHNFWAALLFAFNPITLMVSTWLAGRAYGMVTLFALISWVIPSNAFLLYAASVYWNISALFYPLVFGYMGWKWSWMALLIIPATYWRFTAKEDHVSFLPNSKLMNESNLELRTLHPRKIVVWIKTYGYYFTNVLFCFRMGLFHKYLYTFGLSKKENAKWYSLKKKEFWIGVGALGITIAGIFFGNYYQSLGLMWFLVNVAMWGNLITFNQQIAERYLYLPAVGLMLTLASTFNPWVCSLFLVFYLTRLWWFMPSLTNEYWNVEYNLGEAKDLYYIWLSRGVHRYADGNVHDSIRNMLQSYKLRPEDFKTNLNLFYLGIVTNDLVLAKKHLEEASKCVVEGKEQELSSFITKGTDLVKRIEEGITKEGKCEVNLKEIQLLL